MIPADDASLLSSPPTSGTIKVAESISKSSFTILEDDSCLEEQPDPVYQQLDGAVFDDSTSTFTQTTPATGKSKPRRNSCYILRTPPQLRPRSATSHNLPQPSKTLRDAVAPGFPNSYLSRPLPDRPLPELPTDGANGVYASRPRKSSTASATPSIAPSLLSYVKNESYLEEAVEYGQGQELPIDKDHPGVPLNEEKVISRSASGSVRVDTATPVDNPSITDTSMSNYEGSPLVTEDSKDNDPTLLSPGNYLATTGSTLEEHMGQLLQDKRASANSVTDSPRGSKSPLKKRGDTVDLAIDLSRFPHLQLSESEWMRQTPSPQHVPRRILSPKLGRLWNTLRRNKSRSPLRNIRDKTASRNSSTPQLSGPELKKKKNSNWI